MKLINMMWKRKNNCQNNLFVSIGGGINQIPLIDEAKKLGLQTIGVDKNICSAGILRCDIRIQESIDNYYDIYKKLKELLADGEIIGVLSKSFGSAIKTSSFISNKLKIPLLPFNRVDDFISKERMKITLKKNNINTPRYTTISAKNNSATNITIDYPFVIKPVTGHAKTDVQLIQNSNGLEKYFKTKLSKIDDFIIEEYIKGEEVIVIGIVNKGFFHLVDFTDKVLSDPPYFVDLMHISPSKYSHLRDKIQNIGQNVANSFEIFTSPMIMEIIISENEDIFVIETAPEFGGEFISDVLVPERTGYNVIQESIKAVINNNFSPPVIKKKKNKTVVVKYITGHKGTLLSFNPLKNRSHGVIFSRIFKDVGSIVKKPATNHDRIGVIIAKGKTREEAIQNAKTAQVNYNIRIGDVGKISKNKKL